jgi:single-strand DNA-binding protein
MRGIEVAFVGTLAADPEQRITKAGRPWASFRAAVSTGKDGETTWLRCATFSESAIQATAELKKGQTVYIEGSLRQTEYQDREGQARVGLDVTASLVQPLGLIGERRPKKPVQARPSLGATSQAPGHITDPRPAGGPPAHDEIPFGPEVR